MEMNEKEENNKPTFLRFHSLGGNPREESIIPQPINKNNREMKNESETRIITDKFRLSFLWFWNNYKTDNNTKDQIEQEENNSEIAHIRWIPYNK